MPSLLVLVVEPAKAAAVVVWAGEQPGVAERRTSNPVSRRGERIEQERLMETWPGQYCINVTDIQRTIGFYEAIGLKNTSRTEIPQAHEAVIMDGGGKGGKIQLAEQLDNKGPIEFGNAFWKLYILTNDIHKVHQAALDAGATEMSPPVALERWPVTASFVTDPDGYQVEFVQQVPWPDGDSTTLAWVGQYCIYVSDIEETIKFYELLGLTVASRTEIDHAFEVVLDNPRKGGNRVQLAQRKESVGPIDMGTAMWKLYFLTDDCQALHDQMVRAGYKSVVDPVRLDRWPTTMSYLADPDGYEIELVQLHAAAEAYTNG
jgi:lactoylglutathione lyase